VERPDVRVWQVSPRSDRTGLRLSGEPLRFAGRTADVPSHGLVAGAVQVPGDGRPIVLLANHQTTGGYPVADVVCAADLPLLAQVRPGAAVRFIPVDVPAARAAYEERVAALLGDVTSAAGDPRDR
jgi:allophanate hydrolase subunit 2